VNNWFQSLLSNSTRTTTPRGLASADPTCFEAWIGRVFKRYGGGGRGRQKHFTHCCAAFLLHCMMNRDESYHEHQPRELGAQVTTNTSLACYAPLLLLTTTPLNKSRRKRASLLGGDLHATARVVCPALGVAIQPSAGGGGSGGGGGGSGGSNEATDNKRKSSSPNE
jgi:hypothetical protein